MTMTEGSEARRNGITLWRQIASELEAAISSGIYAPGDRLPTEVVLSQRFSVNRHTVRRALDHLSRAGLVRVEQGRGAFVAEDVLDYTVSTRTRFSEWIRRHNKEPSGEMVRLDIIAADPALAVGLMIVEGAPVIQLVRVGLADLSPVSLSHHHFARDRWPGLADELIRFPTITEALREAGVADYRRQVTRVTARMPGGEEARRLRMPRSRPVLVTESVNVDPAGTVVEFGITIYPATRVQIVFEP